MNGLMKLHIKEMILNEILEHYVHGEQDLIVAFRRASYAFACYGEESDEVCEETFGASSQDVYDAQFDIDKIMMSEVLDFFESEGIDIGDKL